jgi:hypothetical protein
MMRADKGQIGTNPKQCDHDLPFCRENHPLNNQHNSSMSLIVECCLSTHYLRVLMNCSKYP